MICAHAPWAAPLVRNVSEAPAAVAGEADEPGSLRAAAGPPSGWTISWQLPIRSELPGASPRVILSTSLHGPRYSALLAAWPSSLSDASLGGVDLSDPSAILELIGGAPPAARLEAMLR